MKFSKLPALVVFAVLACSQAAQANLITNPGFESGAGIAGWTVGGGTPQNPEVYAGNPVVPPNSGAWALDLGPSGTPSENHGYALQIVSLVAGTYLLDFWHRVEFNGTSSTFGLDLSGAATFSTTLTSTSLYQLYSYQFVAGGGPLTIKFTDKDPGSPLGYNTLIDDVSLNLVEVPEPASGALALLGMLGLAAARARAKKRSLELHA